MRRGQVFCGKTGYELDNCYLRAAGLDRDDVRVMNASACPGRTKSGGVDNPSVEQAACCSALWLPIELRETKPRYVVLLGAVAVQAVLGVGVVDMELQHGLPMQMELYGHKCTVICMYHPSSGLHDTTWMRVLLEDYRALRMILRGKVVQPVDAYPVPEYIEVPDTDDGADELREYLQQAWLLGCDTEHVGGKIWCATVSTRPGTGRFIDARNASGVQVLREHAMHGDAVWAVHNALADQPALAQVDVVPRRWLDTMQWAFALGEWRHGLKILAYRYLGMRMQEYNDVVMPPAKVELYAFMQEVQQVVAKGKVRTLAKRLCTDLEKKWDELKPWDRVDKWAASTVQGMQDAVGRLVPRPSIALVERRDAVHYATRDADACLRLVPVLRAKMRELRRTVSAEVA